MRVRWIASVPGSPGTVQHLRRGQGRCIPSRLDNWIPLRELSRTRLSLASARANSQDAVLPPPASRSERA